MQRIEQKKKTIEKYPQNHFAFFSVRELVKSTIKWNWVNVEYYQQVLLSNVQLYKCLGKLQCRPDFGYRFFLHSTASLVLVHSRHWNIIIHLFSKNILWMVSCQFIRKLGIFWTQSNTIFKWQPFREINVWQYSNIHPLLVYTSNRGTIE